MHPRDLDRLRGWEFDGVLLEFDQEDRAAKEADRQRRFTVEGVD